MPDFASTFKGTLPTVLLILTLSGCNWVDSTGRQGATVDVSLRNAEPVALSESVAVSAPLVGEGADLKNWSWQVDDSDLRSQCAVFDGFDESLSSASLVDACSDPSACQFAIDETSSDSDATRFTLQLPSLRAPVALNYRLQAIRDDGALVERQQLICGLAINEAPEAADDDYLVRPGTVLVVDAGSEISLLANDSDDNDIRNAALRINSIITQPSHAAQFSFDDRGGFLYEPDATKTVDAGDSIEDSFVYSLTDGLHAVRATATVRIVASNVDPIQRQAVPDLQVTAVAGIEAVNQEAQVFDLSTYFSDPDGDSLYYTLSSERLPASGTISISTNGQLRAEPTLLDIGRYQLEIVVSDGIASITDDFLLTVLEPWPSEDNSDPVAQDISNRIVSNTFQYDVSRFFSDPDDDELTFTALGLPDSVEIDTDGIISGQAGSNNRGSWLIRVSANDNRGGIVSDAFRLDIR